MLPQKQAMQEELCLQAASFQALIVQLLLDFLCSSCQWLDLHSQDDGMSVADVSSGVLDFLILFSLHHSPILHAHLKNVVAFDRTTQKTQGPQNDATRLFLHDVCWY